VERGLPGLLELDNEILGDYFHSYVSTYVERDIRLLAQVQEVRQFGRFLSLMSALTAQGINYSQLGREIELSLNTAKRWCSILEQTYQLTAIPPYEGNIIKRISKKSKIFQREVGLVCYLQKISSSTALGGHPMLGALFETVGVHIIRQFSKLIPTTPQFYHWRTNGGAEVNLVLERDGRLFPIEFKCKTNLSTRDFSGMKAFLSTYPKQAHYGAIVYAGEQVYKGTENIWLIPWNAC
jgi:predicted AAA+ superfamily ATPase